MNVEQAILEKAQSIELELELPPFGYAGMSPSELRRYCAELVERREQAKGFRAKGSR